MARNSFFQFKQFKVNQDKSAMKVCTDACVLGAWAEVEQAENILDIGAGTGLLSLMVAQRNPSARVTAVELEENAFAQASENVEQSPFSSQITVLHSAIQDFNPDTKFDCIITNPPFFQSDLKSPDSKINQAHHSESLTFEDLLIAVDRLLAPDGIWNVLLPVDEGIIFQNKADKTGWFMSRKLTLFHQKNKKPFRLLMSFRHSKLPDNDLVNTELYIYKEDGKTYNTPFKKLLEDYYLIF
jgi:tRNA1Val (adenine37-N6)-methyltransferase